MLPDLDYENYLNKAIIFSIYLFAFGTMVSKGVASVGEGLAIIFWLILIIIKNKDYKFNYTFMHRSILIFCLGIIITSTGNWSDGDVFVRTILLFYIIINTINVEQAKRIISITSISLAIALIFSYYQHYILNMHRIESFMSSLAFGGVLATFLIFTITYLIWGEGNSKNKILLLLSTLSMGLGLLFTKSRGAWLGFIGGVVSLSWLRDKKIIIFMGIVLIIMAFVLPQTYVNRFKSSFYLTKYRSNRYRLLMWKSALKMFRDHPIKGVGIGEFPSVYEKEYKIKELPKFSHVHNNFMQFLAEGGLLVFVPFSWMMLSILLYLYKGYKNIYNYKWKLFILASIGAFIMFNLQGLTQFNFEDTETVRVFWLMIALDVVFIKKYSEYKCTQGKS